jgi:dGTPase
MIAQPPAPFATRPEGSRGRLHDEPESASRTPFQRDRDRIIHCAAFRRLEHKTQVFVHHEGDHYRSRLTHSLEVAQIARSISRVLGLNEDLAEALALAHDLGHTPFGHAGEDALDAAMAPFGGFDHNGQTLRIVTRLEGRYAGFDGLNLTWETLEGVVKHNGPMALETLPETVSDYLLEHDLEVATWPGPEAQVAALADDIAYNNHDVDDALRAGLFDTDALAGTKLAGPIFAAVAERYPGIERQRLIHESVRRLIAAMVEDLIAESRRRIAAQAPESVEAVRDMGAPLIGFSDQMQARTDDLRRFLFTNMYRHFRLNRMASKARRVVDELFALFLAEPECLPADWRQRAAAPSSAATARVVCDYIAGMTDRYAVTEHSRLFDVTALT